MVRKSHGFVIKVSDKAILDAVHLLGEFQGVFAEPTGAVALAGIRQVFDRRIVSSKDLSVCLITGLGFKDLNPILEKMELPSLIGDDFDDFQMLLRRLLQANDRS